MTSATQTLFETAIGLTKQAVHHDEAKNYNEAARCYREAISAFHHLKSKSRNQIVSKAIDEKIDLYRKRLVRIDKYLLGKPDLRPFFKSVVAEQLSILNKNKQASLENDQTNSRFPQTMLVDVDQHCKNNILPKGLAAIEIVECKDGMRNEDNMMLNEKIGSNLSLPSISVNTSTSPVNTFVPLEMDTFQKPASENGSRHLIYQPCEIKRSSSLMSGQSDFDMLNGNFVSLEDKSNRIPLFDLDQELYMSSSSLNDGVDRSEGVKSALKMLSSASSFNAFTKDKYRSLHSSAEDVLAAYDAPSTPRPPNNYSYSKKVRNMLELTCVNIDYIDSVAYKDLCLNDSEDSDSGISSGTSPKNSARKSSPSVTPTMNVTERNITKELQHVEEEIISRTLAGHRLLESQGETKTKTMLFTVASVYEPNYSEENINESNLNLAKKETLVETLPRSVTPLSSQHINSSNFTATNLEREFKQPISGKNDNGKALNFFTPSLPSSRGRSRRSKKLHVSRPEEDELTVLSAEEIVEGDSIPTERSKFPKHKLKVLQIKDVDVYGKPCTKHVPPRTFARRHDEEEDNEGLNKGCYYFMSCLNIFNII